MATHRGGGGAAPGGHVHERLKDELADVLLYPVRLADVAGVDLRAAADNKLDLNTARFAVDVVLGVAPKRA